MDLTSTPNSGHTLLVIASDKVNMQIMMQVIDRRDDWNLMTAVNGMEGMTLADTFLPEVVVLDTALSDICAREVLKCLRGNPMTSHIPVIAVSSDAQSAQIQAGLQAGFYRYLTKPFKLIDLLEAIDCSLSYCLGSRKASAHPSACRQSVGDVIGLTETAENQ